MDSFIDQIPSLIGISAIIGAGFSSLINYIFYKKQQNRTINLELIQNRLSFYSTLIDSLESFWMFVTKTKDWHKELKYENEDSSDIDKFDVGVDEKNENTMDYSPLGKLLAELDKSYYLLENILQNKIHLLSHIAWSDWFIIKHLYISIKIRNDYSTHFIENLDRVCGELVCLLEKEQTDIIKSYNKIVGKSGKYLQIKYFMPMIND